MDKERITNTQWILNVEIDVDNVVDEGSESDVNIDFGHQFRVYTLDGCIKFHAGDSRLKRSIGRAGGVALNVNRDIVRRLEISRNEALSDGVVLVGWLITEHGRVVVGSWQQVERLNRKSKFITRLMHIAHMLTASTARPS